MAGITIYVDARTVTVLDTLVRYYSQAVTVGKVTRGDVILAALELLAMKEGITDDESHRGEGHHER